MNNKILITGATGTVGNEVIQQLTDKGVSVRAAVRNLEQASQRGWRGVEPVHFDYGKPETFDAALEGVQRLFLVAPPLASQAPAMMKPVIEKAKEKGVEYIVDLSAMCVEDDDDLPLRQVEIAVEKSGLAYTLLRPNWFMQNCNTYMLEDIKNGRGIIAPAGEAILSFIDIRDIAAVAVEALTTDDHNQKAYTLTGDDAFDHHRMAEILSELTGLKVGYHAIDDAALREALLNEGIPQDSIHYYSRLYSVVRAGSYAPVSADVENILKRKPIGFEQYVKDYMDYYK